ncbi:MULTISPECIES: efflux RND transporter periplasmic adaptor subunit [unclassified Lentimicrobium]|uniref:efflux RND transporter periplasmic adaptor subunit n=1 Tax=unclassified Lentimicrobium TaxID=2677434 RepID=UPI0015538EB7|nr:MULTISPECIES: efflux RND transporter periplasmic adaptor subunit [unclassified Lentimicrobium]NPD44164.1 efflux RND transporter periplasmic adaptor subunit [Lentimicrobium sp. S6]NPD84622.1 efflux RND transporter periplasmic adaptor subunit [Lentimicrobium sp. L6]
MKNIKQYIYVIIPTLIIGMLIGWMFLGGSSQPSDDEHNHEHQEEEVETMYTCSMHPQIKQNKPGLCPICAMDLVPMQTMGSGGDHASSNEISMTKAAASLANIQTLIVEEALPMKDLFLQGKVKADERNIAEITARYGGRIEKLFVNFTGQQVKKGELLATIYSPDLVSAQKELLEALSFIDTRPALYDAAIAKLKLWDLSKSQIKAIEENGEPQLYFDVFSPISGTVSGRHVTEGDYVKEGKGMLQVIDLTKVWVLFDAYESDLPWIKIGDEINFKIKALAQKEFSGKVSFIDAFLNPKTRVVQVRVELDNSDLSLKPEMFVDGVLHSESASEELEILIPQSSILWTGKRAVVYIKVPERNSPTFLYREIDLGAEVGDYYIVKSGLEVGEEIAVNGVFKIDASAQLSGLPSMMNPGGGAVSSGHDHGEMPSLENADDAFTVYGNCSMCKERIETAALSVAGVEHVNWDENTKSLYLHHESVDLAEVHQAIAHVGHDTDLETSPNEVYESLHECCKYDRPQNLKLEEIKVYGNCGMCKERIETAVLELQGVVKADWDSETTMLKLSINPEEVSMGLIHQELAQVGHDTELAKAPDAVYEQLHACCKYERSK